MILFNLSMKLPPEKIPVVLRSLINIAEPVRVQPECLRFRILCDAQDVDKLCIDQGWETKKAFENHLASEDFRVVIAAMDLAVRQPDIEFFTVSEIEGFELLERVRSRPRAGIEHG